MRIEGSIDKTFMNFMSSRSTQPTTTVLHHTCAEHAQTLLYTAHLIAFRAELIFFLIAQRTIDVLEKCYRLVRTRRRAQADCNMVRYRSLNHNHQHYHQLFSTFLSLSLNRFGDLSGLYSRSVKCSARTLICHAMNHDLQESLASHGSGDVQFLCRRASTKRKHGQIATISVVLPTAGGMFPVA